MKKLLLTGLIGVWTTLAIAHSPLQSTTPENEAVIAQMPSEIHLNFKGDIRLTRVTMTNPNRENTELDISGHDSFIKGYTIPLTEIGSGVYVIEWRGLGADGHALNGTFSFTVQ